MIVRILQWATGNVGRCALGPMLAGPELSVVGAFIARGGASLIAARRSLLHAAYAGAYDEGGALAGLPKADHLSVTYPDYRCWNTAGERGA